MEKKKILFLIHTLGGGGAEKVLVNLANNMDSTKFDITVMTILDVGELRYDLKENIQYKTTIKLRKNKKIKKEEKKDKSGSLLNKTNKKKIFLAKLYATVWKYIPTKLVYKLFIKDTYDIEISFLEGICAKVISSSPNKNSKKYAWIHVDLMKQHKSSGVFKNIEEEKNTYSKFDKIICVSKVVREQFIQRYQFEESKVLVKYNAIDKEEILRKSKETCDFKKNKNSILLCSVGRLNAQKAFDRLLRIYNKLIKDNFHLQLVIIGEGTSKLQLEEYIQNHHLQDSITLLGFKKNPYKYLAMGDIFVCSSIAEGFSTVVSEAIILGIPVVTTECAGMKEMLGENNEYGIVTKNEEEALYEGLKKILSDKKIYNNYKKQVKKRSKMFDLQTTVKDIEEMMG